MSTVPFAWADKRILRKIRQSFDTQNTVLSALAVYHALCEIASDEQTDEFKTSIPHIASQAGLCPRTASARIGDLRRIGVISVETPKLKAPSTYRLLPFGQAPALGNGCRTLSNGCRALGKQQGLSLAHSRRKEEQNTPTNPPGGKKGASKKPTVPEQISIREQLKILEAQEHRLSDDCAEQWQRKEHPELVEQLKEVRQRREELRARILSWKL